MCYPVKKLPLEDRPRERLRHHGPDTLATFELLAIILGSGTRGKSVLELAQEILVLFGSLGGLADVTLEDLCAIKGMGLAKAVQVKAALSLASRLSLKTSPTTREIIKPIDAYHFVKGVFHGKKKEIFAVILLDARSHAMKYEVITVGILTQTLVHPREVFSPALQCRAASIILAHNHPSGDPKPSSQDYHVTTQLILASQIMGIPIYDHIIVAGTQFFSMRENGTVF